MGCNASKKVEKAIRKQEDDITKIQQMAEENLQTLKQMMKSREPNILTRCSTLDKIPEGMIQKSKVLNTFSPLKNLSSADMIMEQFYLPNHEKSLSLNHELHLPAKNLNWGDVSN
eukprot:TRINITY_DN3953_c0_g1_i2.p1 TRINITY_DN3953_c0_g1~~TRINITY_DN3953_c0_g1_i2.p1  ORF type:complete len:115 (-),score=17.63 TRINITY_DN3953_c0_g1_i2:155-499(-)